MYHVICHLCCDCSAAACSVPGRWGLLPALATPCSWSSLHRTHCCPALMVPAAQKTSHSSLRGCWQAAAAWSPLTGLMWTMWSSSCACWRAAVWWRLRPAQLVRQAIKKVGGQLPPAAISWLLSAAVTAGTGLVLPGLVKGSAASVHLIAEAAAMLLFEQVVGTPLERPSCPATACLQ